MKRPAPMLDERFRGPPSRRDVVRESLAGLAIALCCIAMMVAASLNFS